MVLTQYFEVCFDFGAHFRTIIMKNRIFVNIHVKQHVLSFLSSCYVVTVILICFLTFINFSLFIRVTDNQANKQTDKLTNRQTYQQINQQTVK